MRGMKNVTISKTYTKKGPVAHVQGGAKSGEVVGAAWAAGKTLIAGICECTGFTGYVTSISSSARSGYGQLIKSVVPVSH